MKSHNPEYSRCISLVRLASQSGMPADRVSEWANKQLQREHRDQVFRETYSKWVPAEPVADEGNDALEKASFIATSVQLWLTEEFASTEINLPIHWNATGDAWIDWKVDTKAIAEILIQEGAETGLLILDTEAVEAWGLKVLQGDLAAAVLPLAIHPRWRALFDEEIEKEPILIEW